VIKVVVFQGPSGSGKTTLQGLLELPKIVSLTTRKKRANEVDGVDYHFTSEEIIRRMECNGELLEVSTYNGNLYATSLASLVGITSMPHCIVLDHSGVRKLKDFLKDEILTIGVYAPKQDCANRLKKRSDSSLTRLDTYEEEEKQLLNCDLIINNSDKNKIRACDLIKELRRTLLNKRNE
jgi:guanylate kinase